LAKRSDFKRRPHDAYETIDPKAIAALAPHLFDGGVSSFAEPCAGNGALVRALEDIGLSCVLASDLVGGVDALTITDFGKADAIISNPPWSRHLLHPLIIHFAMHKPTWLLFDSDWAYNAMAGPYLVYCTDIVAIGRLKWIQGTKSSGKDNASWYRFDARHDGDTIFHGRS
jgi:hypothetical protein